MNAWKRLAAAVLAIGGWVVAHPAVAEEDFPNKPVHIVVGFTAGSVADISARVIGNKMGQILGQQFIVENKPGAGSSLAAEYVARAPKDGYTLFLPGSANIANAAINPKLPFDLAKDYEQIGLVNTAAVILVVHPSLGVNSVSELVALAKSKPGELSYASTGIGSAPHFSGELLMQSTGVKLVHVPYPGSPQAATDLVAGRVQLMFSPATAVIALAQSGKLKVLASAGRKRASIVPDVPTMIEEGIPDFDTAIWFGLSAPAGTPPQTIAKLSKALAAAIKADDVVSAWRPQGVDPLVGGPGEMSRLMETELARWSKVATAAGLKK